MPVIDLSGDPQAKRDQELLEAIEKNGADGVMTYRIALMYRDRAKNTYGTIPASAILLRLPASPEEGRAVVRVMDALRELFTVQGVELTARVLEGALSGPVPVPVIDETEETNA